MPTATIEPGRISVIATGLVEWDYQKGRTTRDNRLRYDGMVFQPGQHAHVERKDARALARKGQIQIIEDLPAVDWYGAPGRILLREPGHAVPFATTPSDGSLRIVQGTAYDAGNACYRFHTSVNEYLPHTSAFVRYITRNNNPFDCPTQYNGTKDPATVRALLLSADVVHCHIDPRLTRQVGMPRRPRKGQVIIRHYHGTQFNGQGVQEADADQVPMLSATSDDIDGFVLVGARLTLCALRPGRIQWLPITVPVDRYAAMVMPRVPGGPFRIAHSPTWSAIKGTKEFLRACARLNKRGVAVEPVLIKRLSHANALALKATADACFDSFALGIQGSGLEAAAMGQPVIAGDAKVADLYREHVGHVPYTFAGDEAQLEAAIERLALDHAFRAAEAERVNQYVRAYHDYPVVARRYADILAAAGARRLD
jgi:hypothetical protein